VRSIARFEFPDAPLKIRHGSIRYKFGDIMAFLESQPGGGRALEPGNQQRRRAGRPRKSTT
jgi:hypothetical protein